VRFLREGREFGAGGQFQSAADLLDDLGSLDDLIAECVAVSVRREVEVQVRVFERIEVDALRRGFGLEGVQLASSRELGSDRIVQRGLALLRAGLDCPCRSNLPRTCRHARGYSESTSNSVVPSGYWTK
jgi:hypothetical protein